MRGWHVIAVALAALGACAGPDASRNQETEQPLPEVRVVSKEAGYGYEIWLEGQRVIVQRHIPAVQGVIAFPDSAAAARVGELARAKMATGMFPPTLSREEVVAALKETSN